VGTFEIIPGLPAYGEPALSFPSSGRGSHPEGFVVKFTASNGHSWVGNFQRGPTRFSEAYRYADGKHILVISGGDTYIVDPDSQVTLELWGIVQSVIPVPARNAFLLEELIYLSLVEATGMKWRTNQLSWDGIRDLSISDHSVLGEGWSAPDDTWHKFTVALETGVFTGGAYDWPEGRSKSSRPWWKFW
jgi:hypothetical protein